MMSIRDQLKNVKVGDLVTLTLELRKDGITEYRSGEYIRVCRGAPAYIALGDIKKIVSVVTPLKPLAVGQVWTDATKVPRLIIFSDDKSVLYEELGGRCTASPEFFRQRFTDFCCQVA